MINYQVNLLHCARFAGSFECALLAWILSLFSAFKINDIVTFTQIAVGGNEKTGNRKRNRKKIEKERKRRRGKKIVASRETA